MLKTNPGFVLRNHLGEEAIRAAKGGDFPVLPDLLRRVANTPLMNTQRHECLG